MSEEIWAGTVTEVGETMFRADLVNDLYKEKWPGKFWKRRVSEDQLHLIVPGALFELHYYDDGTSAITFRRTVKASIMQRRDPAPRP